MTSTAELIKQFNVVARTEYNKAYQEFEPEFKDLLFEYQSGAVASTDFPFFEFLNTFEQFKGQRKHQTFPEGHKFTVTNVPYDMSVDIPRRDFLRAANQRNNALMSLNIYKLRVSEIGRMAKDHPQELGFNLLVNGETNTLGTTFDGQNFFDTSHSYGVTSGSQNNIVVGSGITAANIETDFIKAKARLAGFTYEQSPNTVARKLNRTTMNQNILIIAPTELDGVLWQLSKDALVANGKTNTLLNAFNYMTLPFSDSNDWYMLLRDEPIFRPFLYQIEEFPKLDTPSDRDESVRERQIFTWGAHGSYTVAYGSWWKAIKITNS